MAKAPTRRKHFRKSPNRTRGPALWGKDTLTIERMSQEGRGVASRDGKIVFVSGALMGEQVRAQCIGVKRDYDEAQMIELLAQTSPSAQRIQPACPIYYECGGCSLQHWSLTGQRQHKQANLQSLLQSITAITLEPPVNGQLDGFRHRLRLLVTRGTDRSYALALRQRRSHDATNLTHCLVANTAVNAMLQCLPTMLGQVPELEGLREIEVDADSNNAIGLCFYFAAHPGEKNLSSLCDAVLTEPVVALRVRLRVQNTPQADTYDDAGSSEPNQFQDLLSRGELCLQTDTISDTVSVQPPMLQMAYSPGDFTQTNWEINAALVAQALGWLAPGRDEVALDLFCGIGNFSLPLALHAKSVHAFENDSGMTQRLMSNAQRNGITNVKATTLNLMADDTVLPRADIAIVDPPRAGAKAVCEAMARAKVKRIVYISCHPATLARDARILQKAGYKLSRAASVDMFPHTGHSEAIALFVRK